MAPQVLLEAASYFTPIKTAKYLREKSNKYDANARIMSGDLEQEGAKVNQVIETFNKSTPEDLATLLDADPKIIHSVELLGLSDEAPLSLYARNPQSRAVLKGLTSEFGSKLDTEQIQFVSDFTNKADEIILTYGGITS